MLPHVAPCRTDNCARTVRHPEDFGRIAAAFARGQACMRDLSSFQGGRERCPRGLQALLGWDKPACPGLRSKPGLSLSAAGTAWIEWRQFRRWGAARW